MGFSLPRIQNTYYAGSLGELFEKISHIPEKFGYDSTSEKGCLLWFRGQEQPFPLVAELLRNSLGRYDELPTLEEQRFQNFFSKTDRHISTNPQDRNEWLEVMQHYSCGTRLLDWTESLPVALFFALKSFLKDKDNLDAASKDVSLPCIYVLRPQYLNDLVFRTLIFQHKDGRYKYIEQALLFLDKRFTKRGSRSSYYAKSIGDFLKENRNRFFETASDYDQATTCLFSLPIIEKTYGGRFTSALQDWADTISNSASPTISEYAEEQFENIVVRQFNPLFFLLSHYYTNWQEVPLVSKVLPHFASVTPYHSERIERQRGCFTVAPRYPKFDYPFCALEKLPYAERFLARIILTNPIRIASDVYSIGTRSYETLPDLENYASSLLGNRLKHFCPIS